MPKTKDEKKQIVAELAEKLGRMKAAVFANYEGLTVPETEELRRSLKDEGAEYVVAKKTLLKIAMKKAGKEIDPKTIEGNFATVFGYEDEVAPARVLAEFAKKHEALAIIAGILEDKFVPQEQVLALSRLPSKDELLAKVVGTINAPISGFVNALAGNLRNLVYALNAIKESKSA